MKPPTELEGSLSFLNTFFFQIRLPLETNKSRMIINESVMLIYTWVEYDMRLFMRRSPGVTLIIPTVIILFFVDLLFFFSVLILHNCHPKNAFYRFYTLKS